VLSGIFLNPTGAAFINTIQPNFSATFDYELPRKSVLGKGSFLILSQRFHLNQKKVIKLKHSGRWAPMTGFEPFDKWL
jgi:hypothetical protein